MGRGLYCLVCNSKFNIMPENNVCPKCGHNHFLEAERKWVEKEKSILIKVGNLSTLESMLDGNIWFQSPVYYQNFEGNDSICDIRECAFDYISKIPDEKIREKGALKIGDTLDYYDGTAKVIEINDGKIYVYSNTQNYNRLLCFYGLRIDNQDNIQIPDQRIKNFGTHFSLINMEAIKKIIGEYFVDSNISVWADWVKYSTDNYSGPYNPTFKDFSYSYQNEFRVILRSKEFDKMEKEEPKKIKVDKEKMKEIMTQPCEVEKLYNISTLKELSDLFDMD